MESEYDNGGKKVLPSMSSSNFKKKLCNFADFISFSCHSVNIFVCLVRTFRKYYELILIKLKSVLRNHLLPVLKASTKFE